MKRRDLMLATLGAGAGLAFVGGAVAQLRVFRVAWLAGATKERNSSLRNVLSQRLAGAGFIEGSNLQIVEQYADGRLDRLPELARELARASPDVVLANGTEAAIAAREGNPGIPIVFAFASDPVASGLVANLSRPDGTVTGFTNMNLELIGKRLEVLHEAFPSVKNVAVLYNPRNSPEIRLLRFLGESAATLGIRLFSFEAQTDGDYTKAFAAMTRRPPDALFVIENSANVTFRQRIFDFAGRHRIPAIYGFESFVDAGGLMSYSAPLADQFAGAVGYVVRILQGARVADLPVQLPRRFELVVNLKTARSTGIAMPQSVLLRVDRLIE